MTNEIWAIINEETREVVRINDELRVFESEELALRAIGFYALSGCVPQLLFTSKDYDDLESENEDLRFENRRLNSEIEDICHEGEGD